MATFEVKDGLFWLDGQPILLQAGEFHYFRTPADQWEHRLNLLKAAGFNAVASYIPWLWHQPAPDVSDVTGETHPMRNLAGFLDLAHAMGFLIIARPGPYIMAESINEGIPPWLFEQSPQVAYIGQDGKPQNIVSYLHPDFLHHAERWYEAVFNVLTPRQITRGGSIMMMNLDNEMGMIQWVRNLIDTNPDTLMRFADYLRATYGDALVQRYHTDSLVDFLRAQGRQPDSVYGAAVLEDYRRFYRVYLRDYMAHLWERARAYGMEVPPVVNIHGFGNGGKTFPIGLSQLIDVMQMDGMISATDVYPLFIGEGNYHQILLINAMTQALQNAHQPLFSIEFQSGGNQDFGGAQSSLYDLHTRLSISCGMRGINHYLFFDGENDPIISPTKRHNWGQPIRKDGTPRRHYARYGKLSRVVNAYGQALVQARPKTVTTIGFQLDTFMTEVNNPFTRAASDIITHQRDVILFDFIARGLALTHRPFDALEISRSPLDATQTPLLWVMMDKQCDASTQQKLVEYVQQGGNLVLIGRLCDETFAHEPCRILQDALNVQSSSAAAFESTHIQAFKHRDVPVAFLETYHGDFEAVFATSEAGEAVGFTQLLGAGRVMVLGAALSANILEDIDILHQMAMHMGCTPLFTMSDWLDVRLSQGERGSFLFVNNYQDDPIESTITLEGVPLFDGHPVNIAARSGAILPLNWQVTPDVMVHSLTAEVIAVSESAGHVTLKTAAHGYAAVSGSATVRD